MNITADIQSGSYQYPLIANLTLSCSPVCSLYNVSKNEVPDSEFDVQLSDLSTHINANIQNWQIIANSTENQY